TFEAPAETGKREYKITNSRHEPFQPLATAQGTLDLDSLTVTNSASGTVQVDASSTLDLETAIITGGTVTNSGMLDANTGATNARSEERRVGKEAGATIEATGETDERE